MNGATIAVPLALLLLADSKELDVELQELDVELQDSLNKLGDRLVNRAQNSMDKLANHLVAEVLSPRQPESRDGVIGEPGHLAIPSSFRDKMPSLRHTDLDRTMLGKPSHLVRHTSSRASAPRAQSSPSYSASQSVSCWLQCRREAMAGRLVQRQAVVGRDGQWRCDCGQKSIVLQTAATAKNQQTNEASNGTVLSSQHSSVVDAFRAGVPFGVAMVYYDNETPSGEMWGCDKFSERPEAFKSYSRAEGDGFAHSTRKGIEQTNSSTKWLSLIRRDIPITLYQGYWAYGFLFSLEHLWPHLVKDTFHAMDNVTPALSLTEITDENHFSKSKVYGKRGDHKEARLEFDRDLEEMFANMSTDPEVLQVHKLGEVGDGIQRIKYHNEIRVLGEKLPADAFVGIVQCAHKVLSENIPIQELEAEKVRMISEFKRLTGRADAPIFGYAKIPSHSLASKVYYADSLKEWDRQDIILLNYMYKLIGEDAVEAGGSALWPVSY
eukprot:gnl/TRDRNA2_/TRDRNA2_202121_c0_seq1.p1 gnl/TRDRNA2_/TRDRNA2_202121_c0~~gnl/TRDRNA2_/TRDRNA2_202121_c0_seq1.p1  ORF type:complete len:495 (+),score=51.45 gnl/TRDRNA2_/TRDRNA2_202121_c0_seq1:145-1629(+)